MLYDLELDCHKRALQFDLERFSNHPKVAKDYMDVGSCYRDRGNHHQALQHYQKSMDLYRDVYGEEHHEITDLYKAMGFLYRSMKDYQTSFDYQQKSLAMAIKTLPSNHPYLEDIHTAVGWSYYELEDVNKALEHINKAYTITVKSTPTNSFRMASAYQNTIIIEAKAVSPMNSLQAHTHYELAMVYEYNKRYLEASEHYLRAVEMFHSSNTCEQSIKAEEGLLRMEFFLENVNTSQAK